MMSFSKPSALYRGDCLWPVKMQLGEYGDAFCILYYACAVDQDFVRVGINCGLSYKLLINVQRNNNSNNNNQQCSPVSPRPVIYCIVRSKWRAARFFIYKQGGQTVIRPRMINKPGTIKRLTVDRIFGASLSLLPSTNENINYDSLAKGLAVPRNVICRCG